MTIGSIIAMISVMQNNTSIPDSQSAPLASPEPQPCNCPYWPTRGNSCKLVEEGLFLPTQSHITAYCANPHFSSCDHYQRLTPPPAPRPHPDLPNDNRRRSIRVPQHIIFRFSELKPQHPVTKHQLEKTWTLDLSKHGLCFASPRRLSPDTIIHFSVEEENRFHIKTGQGRIVWSQYIENTGLFCSGVEIRE